MDFIFRLANRFLIYFRDLLYPTRLSFHGALLIAPGLFTAAACGPYAQKAKPK
jgi:hypothetical protein